MKTSARNTFPGKITKVAKGAVNSEIQLTTKGGDKIVAIITNGSLDGLELKEGQDAFALVKASFVILGRELHSVKLSTRNILCGTVENIHEGAVNSEVIIRLGGSEMLTSIITNESVRSLGLRKGEHACGAFKASSVIIGIA